MWPPIVAFVFFASCIALLLYASMRGNPYGAYMVKGTTDEDLVRRCNKRKP